MDAVVILAVFSVFIGAIWWLGAHGLALILAGSAVVAAIVELIWYLRFRHTDPDRRTVSKEAAHLTTWRLVVLSVLLIGLAAGLVAHFWAMR